MLKHYQSVSYTHLDVYKRQLLKCCNVFGLSTAEFGNTIVRKLQHIYFFITAVLSFVLCITSLVMKKCNKKLTFVSFMFLVSRIGITAALTCYRINFIRAGNVARYILRNLSYVDKALNSIGANIPHVMDHILCYVFITL